MTAEFLGERVEGLLDYLDEMFTLHPSPRNKMRARSLRIAVIFVIGIVIFFAVAFVFLFVWLLSKDDISRYRAIRSARVRAFWMYSAHVQWYAS